MKMDKKEAMLLEEWISLHLCSLLYIDDAADLAQYIMSIEDPDSLSEYLTELLDVENEKHLTFIGEIVAKWRNLNKQIGLGLRNQHSHSKESTSVSQKHKYTKSRDESKPGNTGNQVPSELASSQQNQIGERKKTKFISLYSVEGEARAGVVTLPGRHECDCLASRHKLINNCLFCGRIVCQQEGSGPCFFCGNLVVTNEEKEMLELGTKKSSSFLNKLMSCGRPQAVFDNTRSDRDSNTSLSTVVDQHKESGLIEALKQKERLLEYDKTSTRRTRVIDDQSDYFSSANQWLSPEERDAAKKREKLVEERKRRPRTEQRLSLDFAGRSVRIKEEDDKVFNNSGFEEEYEVAGSVNDITLPLKVGNGDMKSMSKSEIDKILAERDKLNPRLRARPPSFSNEVISSESGLKTSAECDGRWRLQDGDLDQLTDDGSCLSMHQPWASLLISGVKIHEGRTWYTNHRGRLWIASAAKPVTTVEIRQIEGLYKDGADSPFPDHYPVGCLLGYVTVVDCMGEEKYSEIYPGGESSASPYILICHDPVELPIKFPIKGKHKIFKLDSKIHQAARKSVERQRQIYNQ